MNTPQTHSCASPASCQLLRDVERLEHNAFAVGISIGLAVGALLASACWLWLTWGH